MLLATKDPKLNKMDVKLHDGIWLGMDGRDGSVGIGTASGVVMARIVRRKPLDSRWSQDEVDRVRGTTRNPAPGIYVSLRSTVVMSPAGEQWDPVQPAELTEPGMRARRARLRPADFVKHGYTLHCDGCRAIQEGLPSRNHNEVC